LKDGVPPPPPLAHLYMFSRGGLWAKQMGLKQGAIGNTLGEHIKNLRKHIGNPLGTSKEHRENKGKMKKKSSPKVEFV